MAERSRWRLKQINVLGSTTGRPVLQARIAAIQDQLVVEMSARIRTAQERGWMRRDVDATALSAWLMGAALSRCLIELGDSSVDPQEWDRIAVATTMYAFFGDAEAP